MTQAENIKSNSVKNKTSVPNRAPESRTGGSATLGDVARLAGVAPATVSRALNHPEKVAAKTLEKINQAIDMTGYVPNLIAGALATRKSHLIAAIIPSISNSVYAETIKFFTAYLRDSGYQVLLGETDYREDVEESLVRTILSRKPDGIFLIGTTHTAACRLLLLSAKIPIVETWDLTPNPLDLLVGFSHAQIGSAVAEYLLGKGHRTFGSVWGGDQRAQMRKKAFLGTLESHGINNSLVVDVDVPTSFKKGRDGFTRLAELGFNGGAIACSSDTLAQGVLTEVRIRDLEIPQQISVIGFGDQAFSAYTDPPLSTVFFDRKKIGQRAAEVLLTRMDGNPVADNIIDVGYQIVERDSA